MLVQLVKLKSLSKNILYILLYFKHQVISFLLNQVVSHNCQKSTKRTMLEQPFCLILGLVPKEVVHKSHKKK